MSIFGPMETTVSGKQVTFTDEEFQLLELAIGAVIRECLKARSEAYDAAEEEEINRDLKGLRDLAKKLGFDI